MSESRPTCTDRWRNRRRMAWVSLIAGVGYPAYALVVAPSVIEATAAPFYLFVSAVLGSYFGWATADDKWRPPELQR